MPAPFLSRTCFPGNNRGQWTMGQKPCSSHCESWLVYAQWKLEHGRHPSSPLHTWTLTFRFGPCKFSPMYWML
jgi:hypothetical protein